MIPQGELIFWGPKHESNLPMPSREDRLKRVDSGNPSSPFSRFVGNERAVRKMQAAVYSALGRPNHIQRDLSFAIFGPASSGKTTLARLYADSVELPLVEVSPKSIRTTDDLLEFIHATLLETEVPLVDCGTGQFVLPPMVIFIDEVHALSRSVVDGLLKATEYKDAILVTDSGSTVDCHNVTWMIATTDEGRLFDAFRTRFSPVVLQYLTKAEVAKIVSMAHKDLPFEVCMLVSHYNSRIPRKALEFARYMKMVRDMHPSMTWEDVARQVAGDEGIDEYGMQELQLKVLRALGQGPVARNRISLVVGRKMEEVERYIMPWLLSETEDQPAMVTVSSKGYVITRAGLDELDKRGISYVAEAA